jgi:Questin oxidase-like
MSAAAESEGRRAFEVGLSDSIASLDEVFDLVASFDYAIPNPFINHAPMACEALTTLGLSSATAEWMSLHVSVLEERFPTFKSPTRQAIHSITPTWGHTFPWKDELGHFRLLPQWMGYFERVIEDDGWRDIVRTWVPRLMPGLVSALFHGVIRTSHAVRALDEADTNARRAELARALANWAVWFSAGKPTDQHVVPGDPGKETVQAAAWAAGCYVSKPDIVALHGVTGAMAVHLLSTYVDQRDTASALRQLQAEHRQIFRDVIPPAAGDVDVQWDSRNAERAVRSSDPHQIKLVEACLRGFNITADPRFAAAARLVTDTD